MRIECRRGSLNVAVMICLQASPRLDFRLDIELISKLSTLMRPEDSDIDNSYNVP